jgi:hypothetical protein
MLRDAGRPRSTATTDMRNIVTSALAAYRFAVGAPHGREQADDSGAIFFEINRAHGALLQGLCFCARLFFL